MSNLRFAISRSTRLALVSLVIVFNLHTGADAESLPVAELNRKGDIDFGTDVLPILRKNCLACHNETDAEGEIILESAKQILEGGSSGPAVVPGKPSESYLFSVASHADEPIMPPEDNEVGAKNLSPQELAILKLWIEQGARAGNNTSADEISWQPLPSSMTPVFAVETSKDGSLIAVGRANQISLHHGRTGLFYGTLIDESLTDESGTKAHLDMVQALCFSPNKEWLVSGGYRTAKIWKRSTPLVTKLADSISAESLASSESENVVAVGAESVSIIQLKGDTTVIPSGAVAATLINDEKYVITIDGAALTIFDRSTAQKVGELPIPANDLVAIDDHHVVVAKENSIRAISFAIDPSVAIVEEFSLNGHAGKITCITAQENQLVSGSDDHSVRIWDLSQKKQVRQLDAGSPVIHVAMSPKSNRVAATSSSGETRIWNSSDGSLVGTIKLDERVNTNRVIAQLRRDIANRQVSNANSDTEAAKKRLKEEEENLKKSEANQTKAAEAKKKKDDETQKANTELETQEKSLAELRAKIEKSTADQKSAQARISSARQSYDSSFAAAAKTQSAYATAKAHSKSSNQALRDANAKLNENKDDPDLQKQAASAKAAADQATTALTKADEARGRALAQTIAADNEKQSASDLVAKLTAQVNDLKKQLKPAEQAVTEKKKVVEKKTKELTDAVKTLETAVASIAQANRAIARAKTNVTRSEGDLATAKNIATLKEADFKKAESSANEFRFEVQDLSLSADGRQLAVLNRDGSIHLFATIDGSPIQVVDAHAKSIEFVGDDKIASLHEDASIRIWSSVPNYTLASSIGTPDNKSPLTSRVTALAISPDGQTLAIGGGEPSRGGELKLYRLADGELLKDLPEAHSDTVYGITFSPDGKMIATAAADRFMKVFDASSGDLIRNFEGHTHHVLSVSWQADARVLATAGADKVVKLWNATDGSQLKTIQGFGKEVTALQHFGPNDQFVAVCGDKSIYRCDQGGARNGIGSGGDFLYSVSSNFDGSIIAFAGHDSIVRVVNSEGKSVFNLSPASQTTE